MSDDQPEDLGQTIIRPNPGGRRPTAPTATRRPGLDLDIDSALTGTGINPLVAAASPILSLGVRLRSSPAQSDIEGLRGRVVRELQVFEKRALAVGASPETVRIGRYVLCATIDDIAQNTPWGGHSVWAAKSMVATFFNEVSGGKRFYDILEQLHKDPGRNGDMLELIYLCLSLGFEGKLRVASRGSSALDRTRDSVFRTVRQHRGEFERELSPHWPGVAAAHRPLTAAVPVWVVAAAVLVLLAGIYMAFSWTLNRDSDRLFAQLGDLPPSGLVRLARAAPPPPPPVVEPGQLERIKTFLAPEIAEKLVTVLDDPRTITIRIRNEGMFPSGKASVEERFLPVLARVGKALDAEPGKVIVVGHTDNVPIRSIRFPSNWDLSVARAEAVLEVVAAEFRDRTRLVAEGRADAEPIAPNDTPEGRERNRRIELVLARQQEAGR